jgi:hypothetical protein
MSNLSLVSKSLGAALFSFAMSIAPVHATPDYERAFFSIGQSSVMMNSGHSSTYSLPRELWDGRLLPDYGENMRWSLDFSSSDGSPISTNGALLYQATDWDPIDDELVLGEFEWDLIIPDGNRLAFEANYAITAVDDSVDVLASITNSSGVILQSQVIQVSTLDSLTNYTFSWIDDDPSTNINLSRVGPLGDFYSEAEGSFAPSGWDGYEETFFVNFQYVAGSFAGIVWQAVDWQSISLTASSDADFVDVTLTLWEDRDADGVVDVTEYRSSGSVRYWNYDALDYRMELRGGIGDSQSCSVVGPNSQPECSLLSSFDVSVSTTEVTPGLDLYAGLASEDTYVFVDYSSGSSPNLRGESVEFIPIVNMDVLNSRLVGSTTIDVPAGIPAKVGIARGVGGSIVPTKLVAGPIWVENTSGGEVGSPQVPPGPQVTESPRSVRPGQFITLRGSGLEMVSGVTVSGLMTPYFDQTDSEISFWLPTDLQKGSQTVVLRVLGGGSVKLQDLLFIQDPVYAWTQLQSDNTVKMYAKNIVGEGKIQFFHNNSEIAWVRASNALNPKLRQANGSSYLVRTRELVEGKNAFEIYQDGKRIWRAAYAG